jgi:putative oxidoreductase
VISGKRPLSEFSGAPAGAEASHIFIRRKVRDATEGEGTKMKSLLFGGSGGGSALADFGLMLLRVFAGLAMALGHGLGKFPVSEGFIDAVGKMGFPAPAFFAYSAALAETAGGILLALGLLTRPAAAFVLFTMTVAFFGVHLQDEFGRQERALLYAFVALVFVLAGSGRFGVDRLIRK